MCRTWLFSILAFALIPHGLSETQAQERSFWVWHRQTPITAEEDVELHHQGVRSLFWNAADVDIRKGKWIWRSMSPPVETLAPGFRVVPVVRLTGDGIPPFTPRLLAFLTENLRVAAGPSGEAQIDFDCPDRLLDDYATALQSIRREVPHLSITALAHWPRLSGFAALTRSVEGITPMFYDMQSDPTGVSAEAPPPPILDPVKVEAPMRAWSACPIPWRAGLPAFARLTVFDQTGLSRGQIPNWSWDDFCFHKGLVTLAPTHLGVTLLRATIDTKVAATPIKSGEMVASRFTDRAALSKGTRQCANAGAAGVVFFRLPDETDPGGASLRDLGALDVPSSPRLVLRQSAEEQLELVNESSFDLPPRLSGEKSDRDRGYALEIDAPAPLFREALAGDFWRVASHANPDAKKPVPTVVPFATRLTFWFSQLRAGAALRTGLLQLAPGASLDPVRYRITHCEGSAQWKPISLSGTPAPPP